MKETALREVFPFFRPPFLSTSHPQENALEGPQVIAGKCKFFVLALPVFDNHLIQCSRPFIEKNCEMTSLFSASTSKYKVSKYIHYVFYPLTSERGHSLVYHTSLICMEIL